MKERFLKLLESFKDGASASKEATKEIVPPTPLEEESEVLVKKVDVALEKRADPVERGSREIDLEDVNRRLEPLYSNSEMFERLRVAVILGKDVGVAYLGSEQKESECAKNIVNRMGRYCDSKEFGIYSASVQQRRNGGQLKK